MRMPGVFTSSFCVRPQLVATLGLVLVAFAQPTPLRAQNTSRTRLSAAGKPERIVTSIEFGRVISGAIGTDGRICIADDTSTQIHCLSSDGRLLWTAGRKGEGPGEFGMIYRVALAPDNALIAYDVARASLSRFSSSGELIDQRRLPMWFSQVGSLVAVSRDTVVVSGAPSSAGLASDSAIHVFAYGDSLAYVRSFGNLPAEADDAKRRMFGPGLLTWSNRRLLYSRRVPYEVAVYTLDGRREVAVSFNTPRPTPVADQFIIERTQTRTRYGFAPPAPGWHRISTAREVPGGQVLVHRTEGSSMQVWDVLDSGSLQRLSSVRAPVWESSLSWLGYDVSRSRMIASTTCDEEPCLVSVSIYAVP